MLFQSKLLVSHKVYPRQMVHPPLFSVFLHWCLYNMVVCFRDTAIILYYLPIQFPNVLTNNGTLNVSMPFSSHLSMICKLYMSMGYILIPLIVISHYLHIIFPLNPHVMRVTMIITSYIPVVLHKAVAEVSE